MSTVNRDALEGPGKTDNSLIHSVALKLLTYAKLPD